MDRVTLVLWGIAASAFGASLWKDRRRTIESVRMARALMKGMVGQIVGILFLIGLIQTFVPPEVIRSLLGGSDQVAATVASAFAGSITLIPAFVAFPLVGSFVDAGASIVPAVAFLTTLTMVGVVTFPLERETFGTKFAAVRNGASFVFALLIALFMGVVL